MGYYTDIKILCPFCHTQMTISLDFSHSKFEVMEGFDCNCFKCQWSLTKFELKFDSDNPTFRKQFESTYGTTYGIMFLRWTKFP